ncbi:putative TGF beta receptor associated protein 1 [Rosellinia necatrix]|uniref:Putative TGF beta receptor associated protein 1 n=1 Tax=Rosellinia necatrix TaxID=77044 RepID=A0A1W2THI5_ROSNE|nr:putative TGF beta receptor associated protein 1 [Rosellinia necatrix]
MALDAHSNTGSWSIPGAGPYVLRTLFADVPLSEDGSRGDIKINCVEYLDGNLYIGTSDSELLHFFQIPPDPADHSGIPTFILASRLRPDPLDSAAAAPNALRPGVQEILLLPGVGKACVLCNSAVTFYSLPELSPAFGANPVKNCGWIGGVDLDQGTQGTDGATILLSLSRKIQVVRIGEAARGVKKIDYVGSKLSVRRGAIVCVADSRSYALLEIDRQLKIPLMSISSLDQAQPGTIVGQAQDISGSAGGGLLRSNSSAQARAQTENPELQTHRRGTSLGNLISSVNRRQEQHTADTEELGSRSVTPPDPVASPGLPDTTPTSQSTTDGPAESRPATGYSPRPAFLQPHIVSPTPEEFLLVTGTNPLEPGIGLFVNTEGEPTRPTIEFERYPRQIVVDGGSSDLFSSPPSLAPDEEGFVLASMGKELADGIHYGLEIQRWDSAAIENETTKHWLEPNQGDSTSIKVPQPLGIRSLLGTNDTYFQEIVDRLCKRRFTPFPSRNVEASTALKSVDSRTALSMERMFKERELFDRDNDSQDDESLSEGWQTTRNTEEEEFARRLAGTTARLAVWSGPYIWWAVRNPLILQLDAQLEAASAVLNETPLKRQELFRIINSFRGRDAKSELEFLTFSYIRQQVGILLLISFLKSADNSFAATELQAIEETLVDSQLDPRVVLSIIPGVRNEVIETRRGIWIFGGVKRTAEKFISTDFNSKAQTALSTLAQPVLQFLRRFLSTWRRKKGFGSISDENEVFRTVDAALLAVLLELDQHSPLGLAKGRSIRTELYELVDGGVDCFDRARTIIESYHRLFVLSRLYQSRKMAQEVLETWRRIIEGERNEGGEFPDGELRVREYLTKISNQPLVQEYGVWLANRNPKLGVQVFADDKGKASKFEPTYVVELLRAHAPEAVKYYLEFLVFGKGHTIYVNELVTYYLDVVVTYLQTSSEAREAVLSTYDAYRALQPPKPTYRQFLTDNAPPDDEAWQSRLRLLQLLGGKYDYDSSVIRDRIASLNKIAEDLLVPETIILDGRERNHENALRLLVHHLGDYDTAVAYCFRGGASIYSIYQSETQNLPPASPEDFRAPKRRDSAPPTQNEQARLFRALLGEFLQLRDVGDRVEQTGLLLEKFGIWFDVNDILSVIPDTWSVDVVAGFLIKALRQIVAEKNETTVARSLSSAQNLKVQHELITQIEEKGPSIET